MGQGLFRLPDIVIRGGGGKHQHFPRGIQNDRFPLAGYGGAGSQDDHPVFKPGAPVASLSRQDPAIGPCVNPGGRVRMLQVQRNVAPGRKGAGDAVSGAIAGRSRQDFRGQFSRAELNAGGSLAPLHVQRAPVGGSGGKPLEFHLEETSLLVIPRDAAGGKDILPEHLVRAPVFSFLAKFARLVQGLRGAFLHLEILLREDASFIENDDFLRKNAKRKNAQPSVARAVAIRPDPCRFGGSGLHGGGSGPERDGRRKKAGEEEIFQGCRDSHERGWVSRKRGG